MISDGTLDELVCSISNDKHFFKEPILLSNCGHCACKQCLASQGNKTTKCRLCGAETSRDLRSDKESITSKKMLEISLDKLLLVIEKQTNAQLIQLKGFKAHKKETIDLQIKFIEEEHEIRIESIKAELDRLHEKFKEDLQMVRSDVMKLFDGKLKVNNDELQYYEDNLNQLRNDIENKTAQTEERFYKYQSDLMKLNDLNKMNYELKFSVSKENITQAFLGEISYRNPQRSIKSIQHLKGLMATSKIRNIIKTAEYEVVKLPMYPNDICALPTKQILLATKDGLFIYDEDFNLLEQIDKIDNTRFDAFMLAVNDRNQLYISDRQNHRIIMTSLRFALIKMVGCYGNEFNQFSEPLGICYKNNYLYVCDNENRRLQILSSDLEFLRSISLAYGPYSIKASDTTICVDGKYFYNIDTFDLKQKYHNGHCRISEINSCFYALASKLKKFYCFDGEGDLVEEVNIDRLGHLLSGIDDLNACLICLDNYLIITSSYKELLIKFKIK